MNAFTVAYQSDKSGFVGLLSYMSILYGALGDVLILGETITVMQIIAALILGCTTVLIVAQKLVEARR